MTAYPRSTVMIARVVGPMLAAMGLAVFIRPSVFIGVIDDFAADAVTPLTWAILALLFGLIILAFHRTWNTSLEIVVTVIGVISLVRGLVLLFIPTQAVAVARDLLGAAPWFIMVVGALAVALGAWIAYGGWGDEIPKRKRAAEPAIDPELHKRTT